LASFRIRRRRINNGKTAHSFDPHQVGIQQNPTYEKDEISNDDHDSRCLDASTDNKGGDECNSISFRATNEYQNPHDDTYYNHINIRPTHAIATDNTYAHILNTKAATFDNTYSHMSNQDSTSEQDTNMETDDSTYNHFGDLTAITAVSYRHGNGLLTVKTNNGFTDDTNSHINENSNASKNQKLETDYDDTTYNHLGDLPTNTGSSSTSSHLYSQGSMTYHSIPGTTAHSNENQKAGAGRYNYAVVNNHPHAASPVLHDDAPHDYFVLEEISKPKIYDYAVVNKMTLAPEPALSPEDGPHEYYVLEPTTATEP